MKLYFVKRTDSVNYDEYSDFVIIAENKKEARENAEKKADNYCGGHYGDWSIINYLGEYLGKEKYEENIVCGSYHAG